MVSDSYLYEIAKNEFPDPPERFPEDSEMRTLSATIDDLDLVMDTRAAMCDLSKQSIDENRDIIEEWYLFTTTFMRTYHRNYTPLDLQEELIALMEHGGNITEVDVPITAIDRCVEILEHLLEVEEKEAFHDLYLHVITHWTDDVPDDWDEHCLAKD